MISKILILSIFIGIILLFIIVFFYFLLKLHREWKEKLRNNPIDRTFKTKQDFIKFFKQKGYSENSIEFVYEKTQSFLRAKDMVLLPSDNLISLYERQEDEWIYVINKWFKKLNRQQPIKKRLDDLLIKHKELNFEYLIELVDGG